MKQTTLLAVAVAAVVLISGALLAMNASAPGGASASTTSTTTTSSLTTTTSSTSSTSSTTQASSTSTSEPNPSENLQLTLSLNTTTVAAGQPFQVTVTEYNTLPTTNNVSVAASWAVSGLELGGCGSTPRPYQDPLGVAVFSGHYTAGNISQGKAIAIFPAMSCPAYVRNETGYLFQPQSDLAQVLPNSVSASPGAISGSVTISRGYADESPSSAGTPFSPGVYTVVGGDEWGDLAFLYVTVQ